jgi:hypothetical protein
MPTYKIQIYGDRNYRSQEILVDGVNSGNAALDVARARYPGANVKSARLVDNYDIGRREEHNRREEDRKRKIEEQRQRFKDKEERIKSSSTPTPITSSGTHQVSYNNTNSGGSSMSMGDIGGLLALGIVFIAIAYWYITIPVIVIGGILWWLINKD